MAEKKFQDFLYNDLKHIFQITANPVNMVEFVKFLLFFKVDKDPELYELICENICKKIQFFTVDEMLTTVVNLSHTLSPAVHEVFEVANLELVERLDNNYDPMSSQLLIQPEDLIKIANTFLDHGQMKDNLKQMMIEHIEEENLQFTYEILSELAVVYALKMDETYKNMFFSKLRMRFIKEIEFLNDETLYKILWAFFKGKAITI